MTGTKSGDIRFVARRDVFLEVCEKLGLIEKGFGRKDFSKLTKKQITDKNWIVTSFERTKGMETSARASTATFMSEMTGFDNHP